MQPPSIGRIVHVNWFGWTLPAIITEVHSPSCVSVTLFGGARIEPMTAGPSGDTLPAQSVRSLTYATNIPTHYTWTWPPRVA